MENNFIEFIANRLLEQMDKGQDTILVLPNKRPALYLQHYISRKISQPQWFPMVYTIEELVEHLSGIQMAPPMYVSKCLYQVYSDELKEKANKYDDYVKWWNIIIKDFNDLDMYMVNTDSFFNYLSEDKALELWNPGNNKLTELQQNYLTFWNKLPLFYTQLKNKLLENNVGYRGMIYKRAAEIIQSNDASLDFTNVIFAGFNALSTSEEKIIEFFLRNNTGKIYWEADQYYLDDENQEAGHFLRKYKNKWSNYGSRSVFFTIDQMRDEDKSIQITGVPKKQMQAVLAGEILNNSSLQLKNTALIPADESLLLPLLYQIPEKLEVNISMGYPISELPLIDFYKILFELLKQFKLTKSCANTQIWYRWIRHPYTKAILKNDKETNLNNLLNDFCKKIMTSGRLKYSSDEIEKELRKFGLTDFRAINKAFKQVEENIANIFQLLDSVNNKLLQGSTHDNKLQAQLSVYMDIIKQIRVTFFENTQPIINDYDTIYQLIGQSVSGNSISFIGNATEGLQLIGLLETRMLQFDEIIITGCNEGVIPKAKAMGDSFIPFEIRNLFGLPTYRDSDSVFAYHFYRLLQGAKKIHLIYNTETEKEGSGEKSRFLLQLEMELKNKIKHLESNTFKFPLLKGDNENTISIPHSEKVDTALKALLERGLSATALMSYKNCSLQFYFKYIEKIKEPDEIVTELEANVIGSILHKILEDIYIPLKGKMLKADDLNISDTAIRRLAIDALSKEFPEAETNRGKNYLFIETALEIIKRFLRYEIEFLKKHNLTIIDLECEISTEINIEPYGKVKLIGKTDRIDEISESVRIIDYKTGFVDAKLLKVDDVQEVFMNHQKDKPFQLLYYYLLYNNAFKPDKDIQTGIINLRKIGDGLLKINTQSEDIYKLFEHELIKLIEKLLNKQNEFVQTNNMEVCSKCSFKNICMR